MPVVPPPRTSARRSPVMLAALGLVVTACCGWWSARSSSAAPADGQTRRAGRLTDRRHRPAAGEELHRGRRRQQHRQARGSVTYGIDNTLDDRPTTAWSSRGKGVGATLTYTFEQPVDLRGITVRNGYQKLVTGTPDRDLYKLNERIRQVRVTTASGSVVWNLKDVRDPQNPERDLGTTRTVS
jgi:hypothetical protein